MSNGNTIAAAVSENFTTIKEGNEQVRQLIADIATASEEQNKGIEQINRSLEQMDKITQGNAANSEEGAAAAEELTAQSKELETMVSQFSLSRKSSF